MIEKIASGLSLDTGQTKTFRNLAESADGDIRIKSTFGTPYRTFVNEYLMTGRAERLRRPTCAPGAKPLQSESERLDPDSHTHASLDMLKLWQFLAGPPLGAGPDSPVERSISVGPPAGSACSSRSLPRLNQWTRKTCYVCAHSWMECAQRKIRQTLTSSPQPALIPRGPVNSRAPAQ